MPKLGRSSKEKRGEDSTQIAGIDLDDDLVAQIDALSSTRTRDLKLPPRLMELYDRTTYRTRSAAITDLALTFIAINTLNLVLELVAPTPGIDAVHLMARLLITAAFAGAIVGLRTTWGYGREGYLTIAPIITMLALAGFCGLRDGPVMLERLMLNAVFAIGAAIVLARIRPRDTVLLTALTIAVFVVIMGVSPGHTAVEKIQTAAFYGIGLAGLCHARLITNKVQHRLFLHDASARVKVREVHELNSRLNDAARTDPLTRIGNRRLFDERFEAARKTAGDAPLCVCMIDIDHFKRLNDELGHGRGDDCLTVVAATLRQTLRDDRDVLVRFGGEEFVTLLHETTLEEGAAIAERLRLAVYALELPNPSAPSRRVTISIGVAATPHAPVDALVRCADQALYRAKQLGRDRVCAYKSIALADDIDAVA